MSEKRDKATLGAGCFWCVEAVFRELEGVEKVVSGYAGGSAANPTYEQVCTGTTGHAETVQITFDPEVISYEELLTVFWKTHDPTTLNRQGADTGSQYRSVIFYHSEEQKRCAESSRREMDASGLFKNPIVTEVVAFTTFYEAERQHQDYYRHNQAQPYCRIVIDPKMEKFRRDFRFMLKRGEMGFQ
ncbi:MAG: peptide-methionine (S)-S-oxide reductase MsrA [Thermodesulfovibrionales bacterium]|jgi:peptide-methionine (S)-S-oxide reductase